MAKAPPIVPGDTGIAQAVDSLRTGKLVGMPTETVYGLAADASNPEAVARIFAVKGRPSFNPLISHVGSLDMAVAEGVLDERAVQLAKRFWPGPLTLVVPVRDSARTCELARAGLGTIGLRVPRHSVTHALLNAFGGPVSAPSANLSGQLSPTCAEDVAREFGEEVATVVDGGPCRAGIESTIVSSLPDDELRLLRPGAISRSQLELIAGPVGDAQPGSISAPGQLSSHYAPNARLRMDATDVSDSEVLLGFGPDAPEGIANLSARGDPVEAAANLYRLLRELDANGAETIAVMPIPDIGLGEAINDRLRRASAPR